MTVYFSYIEVMLILSTEMTMFWDETLTEKGYLVWLGIVQYLIFSVQ